MLIFDDVKTIRSIFAHAIAAGKHHEPYMEVDECPKCHRVADHELFSTETKECSTCSVTMDVKPKIIDKPAFYLVHDQGIYIMSGSPDRQLKVDGEPNCVVAYAKDCDPNKDTNWWETARERVGGDDFGIALNLEPEWAAMPFVRLEITVTDDEIESRLV